MHKVGSPDPGTNYLPVCDHSMGVAELHPPQDQVGTRRLSRLSEGTAKAATNSLSWATCMETKPRKSINPGEQSVAVDGKSQRGSVVSSLAPLLSAGARRSANPSMMPGIAGPATSRRGQQMINTMQKQVLTYMQAQGKVLDKEQLANAEVEDFWELILGKLTPTRKFFLQVVTASWFDGLIAVVVMCNAMMMALESEVDALAPYLYTIELVFLAIYTVEVVIRVYVFRSLVLNSKANILDMVVVLLGWISDVAIPIAIGGSLSEDQTLEGVGSGVVLLKLLRALRVLRCIRLIAFFDGLWLVVHSFFFCLRPLLWTCIFISVVIFVFTIFAVELIGNGSEFKDTESQRYFLSTVPAFVTLFQLMTLDEWREVIQPICDVQAWAYLFFFFFICISALALMNLVTAVVVENGMRRIEQDDDYKGQMLEREQVAEVTKIRELFKFFKGSGDGDSASANTSGAISAEDLLAVKGSWAALERILDTLGIDQAEDMKRLMKLIDTDGDGELSLEECLDGLLQLRSVSEDKYRTALIQSMDSQEAKFSVLQRVLSTMPEAMAGKLDLIYRIVKGLEQHLGAAPSDDRGTNRRSTSAGSRKREVSEWHNNTEDVQSPRLQSNATCPGSSELLRVFNDFKAHVDAQLDQQDAAIKKLLSMTTRIDSPCDSEDAMIHPLSPLHEPPRLDPYLGDDMMEEIMQKQGSSATEGPRRAADESQREVPRMPEVPENRPVSSPEVSDRPKVMPQEAWGKQQNRPVTSPTNTRKSTLRVRNADDSEFFLVPGALREESKKERKPSELT